MPVPEPANAQPPTPAAVYAEYEQLIVSVERWIAGVAPTIAGCDNAHVRARFVQRVIQVTESACIRYFHQRAASTTAPGAGTFSAAGVTIEIATGRVWIGPRQWLRNLAYASALWLDMLVRLLWTCLSPGGARCPAPVTVMMEAGTGYGDSDAQLVEFCDRGPVNPLNTAATLLIRTKTPPRRPVASRLRYSSSPFVEMARTVLSPAERWALLGRHLSAPWLVLRAVLGCPMNVLAAADLALVPIVRWLDERRRLEALFITTSAFAGQPLWMKGLAGQRFKLHMVWYSQNCIPKVYPGDDRRRDLPPTRHIRADVHWVWTDGFKAYLRGLGFQAEINAVGPLLWYLPDLTPILSAGVVRVALFDITPLPEGKTAFGASRNYYTPALMKKFVADIIEACERIASARGVGVFFAVKHKRPPLLNYHETSYLEYLDQLVQQKPNMKLIDYNANLFGLLNECDLSLSVPYTSTALLSADLATPGIYYDPFAELVPFIEDHPHLHFASGVQELTAVLERCFPNVQSKEVS